MNPQVFKTGEVYLIRVIREAEGRLKYYAIEDESDEVCSEFPIAQHNTIVTKDSITVKWFDRTITLILDGKDDTFKFYGFLLPLAEFNVSAVSSTYLSLVIFC